MKNTASFVLVILMLTITIDSCSQSKKSEGANEKQLYLGYGFLFDVQIMALFSNTYSKIASGISGDPINTDYKSIGPFIVGYQSSVSERISIGPELNILDLTIIDDYSNGSVIEDRLFFSNLSFRFNFYFYEQSNIKMFTGLSLGATYISDLETNVTDDNSTFFLAYQLNILGLQLGNTWSGYLVFGFGRNGLMNMGISKRI